MKKTVLIVEDNELNMKLFNDLLEANGYATKQSKNGFEAIELAKYHLPDLILMDMRLPVMDGPTATKIIRQLPGYAQTPIIALTANAFHEDRQTCLDAGMNDFISKPVRAELLMEKLAHWLGQSVTMPAAVHVPVDQTPPDSDRLRALFAAIPDIDCDDPIVTETEPERYFEYLCEFAKSYGSSMSRLRDLLREGARPDATELVHSLRGTSGMIGIHGVFRSASALEQSLKQGEEMAVLEPMIADLEGRLTHLRSLVNDTLAET